MRIGFFISVLVVNGTFESDRADPSSVYVLRFSSRAMTQLPLSNFFFSASNSSSLMMPLLRRSSSLTSSE